MGIFQLLINPGLGFGGQLVRGHFPGRYHYLAVVAVEGVAVNVGIQEAVVEANFLQLSVGTQQGLIIPQANIVYG
jgi:hypothetical protein